jgi:predicted transcriptional regulator
MAVKISGKVSKAGPRTVSVKLRPATIAQLKRKAKAEKTTAHALMRDAILAVVAA